MFIKDLAKIIGLKGIANKDMIITVQLHSDDTVLWKGPAKELIGCDDLYDWTIVECLIDWDSANRYNPTTPDYNYDKIITVV